MKYIPQSESGYLGLGMSVWGTMGVGGQRGNKWGKLELNPKTSVLLEACPWESVNIRNPAVILVYLKWKSATIIDTLCDIPILKMGGLMKIFTSLFSKHVLTGSDVCTGWSHFILYLGFCKWGDVWQGLAGRFQAYSAVSANRLSAVCVWEKFHTLVNNKNPSVVCSQD